MATNKTQLPAAGAAGAGALGKKPFNYDWLCAAIFLVVTAVTFSSFIFSDDMLVASDQMSGIDMKQWMTDGLVRDKHIPTWFNSRLAGMPSIDAMFSDALYPVTTVIRPFVPGYRLFGWTMITHVFLAGLFFYFMLRRSFGLTRLIALSGALFYMLSPQFVSHVSPGHDGKMFVIAWLPFMVWRLRSLMFLPTLRNACIMAAGLAMMILSPHVQMTYFVLMGLFLYWAADIVLAIVRKEEKRRVVFKAAFFWGAVFIGLGLSFAQLWPSYMFVHEAHSVRGVDRGFEFAASWSMHWAEFFSLWVHEFGNALEYYWGQNYFKLNTEYAGLVPLMLSALAVVSKPKSVWRIFWAAVAVFAVLFSLGANTPFFTAAYHLVPGVKRFRAPSMVMFWFTFSTALMAAFFIKDLLTDRFKNLADGSKKKWTIGLGAAMGAVTLVAALFSVETVAASFARSMIGAGDAANVFRVNYSEKFVPNLWLWWFFTAAPLGMLAAVISGKLKPVVLVYTLIAISVIDMSKVNSQFIKTDSPRKYFYQNDPTLTALKNEHAKTPFRVFTLPRTFPMQNQEGVYGLEGVSGFHDNELVCYRNFRGEGDANYINDIAQGGALSPAKLLGNTPFLDLANVEYLLGGGSGGGIAQMRNPTSLGRLSYASAHVVLPEDKIVDALKRREYDYRTTVALLEDPELPFERKVNIVNDADDDTVKVDSIDTENTVTPPVYPDAKRLTVEWKKYTPNKRIANIKMPADGFLRISEVYYPGWRMTVNGTPAKYYRSDMAWMAIPLKAGDYEIIMEPRSLYLDNAMTVSLIFLIAVAGVLVFGFVMKRKSKSA